jgi:hypothetical protein
MKFRTRGDSIRLRLKRSEVDQIAAGKSIVEETHFPGSVLSYRLDVSDSGDLRAVFADGNVVVTVPASQASRWASTDQVSLMATQELAGGGSLTILIEKDFSCLTPGHGRDDDDDADTFPHPHAASKGC